MDTNKLKNLAETKFAHALFRKNLKERTEAQLAVTHNGGLFRSTPELMCFVRTWTYEEDLFLEDTYGNPIKCDPTILYSDLKSAYQCAMNDWHIEFEKSKKIRNASNV